jgi:REP element-mobilizing transposase RayT
VLTDVRAYYDWFLFYFGGFMRLMIGYMLTWPTYGSWLQGGEKGFVKDGVSYGKDSRLLRANTKLLQKPPVKLNVNHKQIIRESIYLTGRGIGQEIFSLAVCSNHVHIVGSNAETEISTVVREYKRRSSYAMKKNGVEGKVWAKGYDKQFCFDEKSLQALIDYVDRHLEG